jgi:DNA-binding transcriptional MerR regulator
MELSSPRVSILTTRDATQLTGLSPAQLHHWDQRGVVSPSLQAGDGSGSRRRYSRDDLLLLLVARELRGQDVGLAAIKAIAHAIRTAGIGLDCPARTYMRWTRRQGGIIADTSAPAAPDEDEPVCVSVAVGAIAARARDLLNAHAPVEVGRIQVGRRSHRIRLRKLADRVIAQTRQEPRLTACGAGADEATARLRRRIEHWAKERASQPDAPRRAQSTGRVARSATLPSVPRASTWGDAW